MPSITNKTRHSCVMDALEYLTRKGDKPLTNTFVVDCQASIGYRSVMRDQSICLTRARYLGYWLTNRARLMTRDEMLHLQGMERNFKQVVSNSVLGKLIGNAMSQNVLERLLIRLLPAAGLISKGRMSKLKDRWAERSIGATPSQTVSWLKSNKAYKRKLKLQQRGGFFDEEELVSSVETKYHYDRLEGMEAKKARKN